MPSRATHILVVDDDRRIRSLLKQFLVEKGYFVSVAADASQAREELACFQFDLLIVDVMMPEESGLELTASLQGKIETPILMLTAMGEVEHRIAGLESGAEDYLGKPFDPQELLLRVNKLIARTRKAPERKTTIRFGDFTFDPKNNRLLKGEGHVELTSQETVILSMLIKRIGHALSRDELAELCGGINSRSIDVIITRLRTKIESNPKNPVFLKTVWGRGYVFYN
jgi:two-component system phosphate regulon response regulator OmpR